MGGRKVQTIDLLTALTISLFYRAGKWKAWLIVSCLQSDLVKMAGTKISSHKHTQKQLVCCPIFQVFPTANHRNLGVILINFLNKVFEISFANIPLEQQSRISEQNPEKGRSA